MTTESTEAKILKAIDGLRKEVLQALEDYLPRREAEIRFKRLEDAPVRAQGHIGLAAMLGFGVVSIACSGAGLLLGLVSLLAAHWH